MQLPLSPRWPPWQTDSRLKRTLLLGTVYALLLAVAAAVVAFVVIVLTSTDRFSDRLVEAGDVLAGGTLALALLAAVVAVLAYAAATGVPDLKLQVQFEFSYTNQPVFDSEVKEIDGWVRARKFKQTTGRIVIRNVGKYSARNPAVVIKLNGMAFLIDEYSLIKDWQVLDFMNTVGVTSVEWDGGPTYSIHGNSKRQLPIDLSGLCYIPDSGLPSLTFELQAEGYRREVTVPVNFKLDEQLLFPASKADPAEWF
jgi:hypothetical protein